MCCVYLFSSRRMDKFLVGGVVLFVVTELLCTVALLTPDWIVSDIAGHTKLGLAVQCRGTPESEALCHLRSLHPAWVAAATLVGVAMAAFAVSIVTMAVTLRRNKQAFERAGKWSGFAGTVSLCVAGVVFPVGFSSEEIGSTPYLLPHIFTPGYSYILFNVAILVSIIGLLLSYRLFFPNRMTQGSNNIHPHLSQSNDSR